MTEKVCGVLIGLRVVVFDREQARRLYTQGFYGKPLGIPKPKQAEFDAPLELDFLESVYLTEKGILEVVDPKGRRISLEELMDKARESDPRFDMLYKVYKEIREAGYVVRSGLKFGSDFAVYKKGPGIDHAPFLIHVLSFREYINPLEIVRAGRLSHSVRKKFVIAAVNEFTGEVTYISFDWSKP